MLRYEDVIDKTIIEIFTNIHDRYIHFLAYGYFAEGPCDNGKDHRFLEYTWFIAPLKDAMNFGIAEFESEFGCFSKQYIEDCTADEMVKLYMNYNSGKCPVLIESDDVDLNIPDGVYILT